jgi:HicB-like protein involved in pilus formation
MKLSPHVEALVGDLEAVAAAGDDRVAEAASRLAAALRASAGLRLLDALSEAVLELNGRLASGRVEVRLEGRDPSLVLVEEAEEPQVASAAAAGAARITLRLPEALKAEAEAAAAREGVSVNTWLVRAVARAVSGPGPRGGSSRGRLTGYGRS